MAAAFLAPMLAPLLGELASNLFKSGDGMKCGSGGANWDPVTRTFKRPVWRDGDTNVGLGKSRKTRRRSSRKRR